MSVRYIFNTSGDYVAFISGDNLFNPDCDWIGFIKNGNEVYNSNTLDFMGYVLDDDRIARKLNDYAKYKPFRPYKPYTPYRPYRPYRRMRMYRLPYPYEDIFEN